LQSPFYRQQKERTPLGLRQLIINICRHLIKTFTAIFLHERACDGPIFWRTTVVLCSSKTITKEATEVAARFGRSPPDPGFGPVVELLGRHLHCSFNLLSIGKALASKGITTEQAPPPLLEIEPARAFGDEHMLEARMLREPGTGLQTVMTAQIVVMMKRSPIGLLASMSLSSSI